MSEIWLPVNGMERYYQVSNLGRVKSMAAIRSHGGYRPRRWPERQLATGPPKNGRYRKLVLYGDESKVLEIRLHVLVALHFVPNPLGLPFVCHKDDDASNNEAVNLYWGTHQTNAHDKTFLGGAAKKLTKETVLSIRESFKSPYRGICKDLAAKYRVSVSTISRIKDRRLWGHV